MDTIFAPATAVGRAGVAIVRISGPEARAAAGRLTGPLPETGRRLRDVRRPADGDLLDKALVLVFPAGHSFTGEETVELHLHGAPTIVQAVCAELAGMPGLRPAEAGEFTRRAFANGKLDLVQVEGLADLIDAETEEQRRPAAKVLDGTLSREVERWRALLVRALALIEATIDFADEDVPVDVGPEVGSLLRDCLSGLRAELQGFRGAELVRDGFEVAIVGPPNVGKSTLLNRLAGREAAITSTVAGTTRDVIEVRLEVAGLPVTLLDTAGLRETADTVERLGVERARSRAGAADLRIILVEPGTDPAVEPQGDDIVLAAKADLTGDPKGISGATGQGVTALLDRIGAILRHRTKEAGLIGRERQRAAVMRAAEGIDRALSDLDILGESPDLVAEEVRIAVRALESLVGRIDVEHVLGEIFSSFCIGK